MICRIDTSSDGKLSNVWATQSVSIHKALHKAWSFLHGASLEGSELIESRSICPLQPVALLMLWFSYSLLKQVGRGSQQLPFLLALLEGKTNSSRSLLPVCWGSIVKSDLELSHTFHALIQEPFMQLPYSTPSVCKEHNLGMLDSQHSLTYSFLTEETLSKEDAWYKLGK